MTCVYLYVLYMLYTCVYMFSFSFCVIFGLGHVASVQSISCYALQLGPTEDLPLDFATAVLLPDKLRKHSLVTQNYSTNLLLVVEIHR